MNKKQLLKDLRDMHFNNPIIAKANDFYFRCLVKSGIIFFDMKLEWYEQGAGI